MSDRKKPRSLSEIVNDVLRAVRDYYDSEYTYKRLFEWIDQNHFKTGEYSYKEAVIDELTTASSDEYLTKISVQIL